MLKERKRYRCYTFVLQWIDKHHSTLPQLYISCKSAKTMQYNRIHFQIASLSIETNLRLLYQIEATILWPILNMSPKIIKFCNSLNSDSFHFTRWKLCSSFFRFSSKSFLQIEHCVFLNKPSNLFINFDKKIFHSCRWWIGWTKDSIVYLWTGNFQ